MNDYNKDCKNILGHDILLHVKVIGYEINPVIKSDFVREFTPDVSKRPIIFFDKSLDDLFDKEYSKWRIWRHNGPISKKDFKSFISLPNVKKRNGVAPAGNTYVDYYI